MAGWTPSGRVVKRADELVLLYPEAGAACIPILHEIQAEAGFVPEEAVAWVARRLSLPRSRVMGVISFYTMLRLGKIGKHHLELCTNVSCSLCGSETLLSEIEKELGIKAGETTPDGLFTLSEVECLATCGMGPAMQVGDTIHEQLTPQKVRDIIQNLKRAG